MLSHKNRNHKHKRKNSRKIKGGASFFDPLTKYMKLTSNTNQKIADMQKDKNTISDLMNQLTKTYNNVVANVENLESRIEGLTQLNDKCGELHPEVATTSNNNSGFFSFFGQTEAKETPKTEEAPKEEVPKEEAPKEEAPKEEGMFSSLFSNNSNENKQITTSYDQIKNSGDELLKKQNEILEKENEILTNIKNPATFGNATVGNNENTFGNATFGEKENTFGNVTVGNNENAFGEKENAFGEKENAFGNDTFGEKENAFGENETVGDNGSFNESLESEPLDNETNGFPESNDTDLSNYEEKKKGGKRKSRKYKKHSKKTTRKYYL
jgi:hypothetical protein